jgi:uncharacterized protein YbaA (DUF1428 family)
MYVSIYIYRAPKAHAEEFVRIVEAAGEILIELGAIGYRLFLQADLCPKYGCLSFPEAIPIAPNEEFYVEYDEFADRATHDEVMWKADHDPRIIKLYEELEGIMDVGTTIRGEFTGVRQR